MRDHLFSNLLLVLLAAIWGASFILIKIGLGTLTPMTIAAGRISIAAVFLLVAARARGLGLPPAGKHWFVIVIVALVGNALPFSLIGFGEQHIDSSLASILMATIPLFTIVLAHIATGDERLSFEKAFGVVIGFAGIVVLVGPSALLNLGSQAWGQLLIVAASLSYAMSSVLSRRLAGLPKLQVSAAILLVSALMIVPAVLVVDRPWHLRPDGAAIGAVLVLGVLSTAAAQLVLLKILELRGASFLSLNNYLVPLFGLAWGMTILNERPGPNAGLALAIILAGVLISQGMFSRLLRRHGGPA